MKKILFAVMALALVTSGSVYAYSTFFIDRIGVMDGDVTISRFKDPDNANVVCYIVRRTIGDPSVSCLNLPIPPVTYVK